MATVVSFESVGAILVIAFLVVPAASAYLITDNFKRMTLLIMLQGLISAALGYFIAEWVGGSIRDRWPWLVSYSLLLALLGLR